MIPLYLPSITPSRCPRPPQRPHGTPHPNRGSRPDSPRRHTMRITRRKLPPPLPNNAPDVVAHPPRLLHLPPLLPQLRRVRPPRPRPPLRPRIQRLLCDTGSPVSKLSQEFGGKVDLSLLDDNWNSNTEQWSPHCKAIDARAKETRRFLRQFGRNWLRENDGDCHIVVSTHGGFLHYVTEEWAGTGGSAGTGWRNYEFRSFTFGEVEDEGASLVELQESRGRRSGENLLSRDEHRALREFAQGEWVKGGYQKLPLPDVC